MGRRIGSAPGARRMASKARDEPSSIVSVFVRASSIVTRLRTNSMSGGVGSGSHASVALPGRVPRARTRAAGDASSADGSCVVRTGRGEGKDFLAAADEHDGLTGNPTTQRPAVRKSGSGHAALDIDGHKNGGPRARHSPTS